MRCAFSPYAYYAHADCLTLATLRRARKSAEFIGTDALDLNHAPLSIKQDSQMDWTGRVVVPPLQQGSTQKLGVMAPSPSKSRCSVFARSEPRSHDSTNRRPPYWAHSPPKLIRSPPPTRGIAAHASPAGFALALPQPRRQPRRQSPLVVRGRQVRFPGNTV